MLGGLTSQHDGCAVLKENIHACLESLPRLSACLSNFCLISVLILYMKYSFKFHNVMERQPSDSNFIVL